MSRTEEPRSREPGSPGESREWLTDYLPSLARLATALTGDPATAARLVSTALFREGRRPSGSTDFAEARLRALVVQHFLATGPGGPRDRLSRACLVLRHLEGLTLAETAAVVDRPIGTVAGLAQDELDPIELRRGLVRLADAAPDARTVWASVAEGARLGRPRRRRLALLVLVGAVLVALVLVPTVIVPRLPGETRAAGEWRLIHRVKPPPPWAVVGHTVTPTYEATTVRPDRDTVGSGDDCRIQVYVPGGLALDAFRAQRDPVRVRGHRAFFSEGDGIDFGPFLAWTYARDAWSLVSCSSVGELDRAKLISLAESVRFRRDDFSLPFRLPSLPNGYRVESATQGVAPVSAEVILAMTEIRPGDANMSLTYHPLDTPADNGANRNLTINGRPAVLDDSPSNPRLCLAAASSYVCLGAYWPFGAWPVPAPTPVNMRAVLIRTAQDLALAGALDDPSSWFDAKEALPAA